MTIAKGFRCGARRISAKKDLDGALEEMLDSDRASMEICLSPIFSNARE